MKITPTILSSLFSFVVLSTTPTTTPAQPPKKCNAKCSSDLIKCDARLAECREGGKHRDKMFMQFAQKTGKLKHERDAAREQNMWYFLGGAGLSAVVTSIIFITVD